MNPRFFVVFPVVAIFIAPMARADDDTIDWLMKKSTTAPATQPAAIPASQPTVFTARQDPSVRPGKIILSDGKIVQGNLATTPGKPLRIFEEKESVYHDIAWSDVASITSEILWERQQEEWHFKDSGSDIKEFTGKTYPARELVYIITQKSGKKIKGSIAAPIYIDSEGKTLTFILHKRDKGEVGKQLADLVYVDRIELSEK